jgi:hypothetical protein
VSSGETIYAGFAYESKGEVQTTARAALVAWNLKIVQDASAWGCICVTS